MTTDSKILSYDGYYDNRVRTDNFRDTVFSFVGGLGLMVLIQGCFYSRINNTEE